VEFCSLLISGVRGFESLMAHPTPALTRVSSAEHDRRTLLIDCVAWFPLLSCPRNQPGE
jgi:hypothetical protein